MIKTQKGFRCKLTDQVIVENEITIEMEVTGPAVYDFSCFGVDSQNKLSDDRYMVFYNQLTSPNREIVQEQRNSGVTYRIKLTSLPASINKLVFTVAIDGNGTMSSVGRCLFALSQNNDRKLLFELVGSDFQNEKALIVFEIYKKDVWRMATIGSGFDGGLSALLKSYGGEEASPASSVGSAAAPSLSFNAPTPVSSKISLEKRIEKEAPALISLVKPLTISLKKNNLTNQVAKVGLVMDISGSMIGQYQNGTVQEIVNKIIPLALQFDDDGDLDFWYYGSSPRRMPAVTVNNYRQAVPSNWHAVMWQCGCGNNEPAVMVDVINEYRNSTCPAYVILISDGGVGSSEVIKRLLIESSRLPIFWQLVGVGGSSYGVFEKLDTMSGRFIDNANFFALDDFRSVSNEVLYDRLLAEFPQWLKEARAKGVIPKGY